MDKLVLCDFNYCERVFASLCVAFMSLKVTCRHFSNDGDNYFIVDCVELDHLDSSFLKCVADLPVEFHFIDFSDHKIWFKLV